MSEKSQDLTEQWKNGKLKQGWYYIECFDEPEHWIDLDFYRTNVYKKGVGYFSHNDWRGIAKVIAPAPSYEEWQNINEFADYSIHNRNELTKQINYLFGENEKLSQWNIKAQELLKECRKVLDLHSYRDDLPARIDEVLK